MTPKDAFDVLRTSPGDPRANATLFPLVTRISKAVTWKTGRQDVQDDIVQEAMLCLPQIASRLDHSLPPEPYLIKWIGNIALALSRKNPLCLDTDEREKEDAPVDLDPSEPCAEDEYDRKSALRAIESRLQQKGVEFVSSSAVPVFKSNDAVSELKDIELVPKRRNRTDVARELSGDHKEIRDIRQSLDMTQGEFAAEIGIPLPTLVCYEHGRTKKVPQKWMELARELRDGNQDKLAWRKRFDALSMKEIVAEWAKALNADPSDMQTMAALTGTTVSTISRWMAGHVRPSVTELIAYAKVVEINAARLEKSRKAIASKIEVRN